MLIQERTCMEQNNLRWNIETKKYEFAFDPNEANNYTFVDSNYLGKERKCVNKGSETQVDAAKAQEVINNTRLRKEYTPDLSNNIIDLLKQVISIGTVLRYENRVDIEEKT